MSIAIIGAGLAGLVAARALVAAGSDVVVFEKSGGFGGRIATRRAEAAAFDHGAPLLHGLSPAGAEGLDAWRDGALPAPGASAFGRRLAAGLDVRTRRRVVGLTPGWTLRLEDGTDAQAETVLLAVPAPQAIALIGEDADRFAGLDAVRFEPGWTLMAAFDASVPGPVWRDDLAPPIARAIRNSGKPGRDGPEAWVAHADAAFVEARLEDTAEAVAADLVAAFRQATGAPQPAYAVAHRWRYARVAAPLGRPCLWDGARRLGLCGDWCLGPDAGDAEASGSALAAAVLEG
jgi:predicted NAD/FAD-dependent oxidoreductase